MSTPHRIIAAAPQDWPLYKAVRLRALEQDPDAFGSTLERELEQPEAFWRVRLERSHLTLIALDPHDAPIALAALASAWTGAQDAGLYQVWLHPQARGAGLAHTLLTQLIDFARKQGFARIVLEVGQHNEPARRLYARLGFEPTGHTSAMPPPREHIKELELALELHTPSSLPNP